MENKSKDLSHQASIKVNSIVINSTISKIVIYDRNRKYLIKLQKAIPSDYQQVLENTLKRQFLIRCFKSSRGGRKRYSRFKVIRLEDPGVWPPCINVEISSITHINKS